MPHRAAPKDPETVTLNIVTGARVTDSKTSLHRCRVATTPCRGVHCTWVDSGRYYEKHWHDTYSFGYLDRGAQRSGSGRGLVEAYPGDLMTANPGEVHDGHPLGGPRRRWLMVYVDPDAWPSIAGADESPHHRIEFTFPVLTDRPLQRTLHRLFGYLTAWERDSGESGVESLAFEESLVLACSHLRNHYSTAVPIREVNADVRDVRERLADEGTPAPTLSELAALVGLSRYQVVRRFRRCYGMPPHAWLRVRRAERARRLIQDSPWSLAEIAIQTGFADQSHMTRAFAQYFGFTPGAWRKATSQG